MLENNIDMSRLIGNVAHDLKTPLSAFSCGMDLIDDDLRKIQALLRKLDSSEKNVSKEISLLVTSIEGGIANMKNINTFMVSSINRCIDYSKSTTGVKLTPKFETIAVQEILDSSIKCVDHVGCKSKIVLVPPVRQLQMITDKHWLQENIICLLSNAAKYSHHGNIQLRVALVPQHILKGHAQVNELPAADIDFLRVEVEDRGIGVSSEVAGTLFKPFQQAQKMAGGTGLGLYSLALRVDALGGRYGVAPPSSGDEGSVFWFEIPYRPDHPEEEGDETITSASTPGSFSPQLKSDDEGGASRDSLSSFPPLNILLVDDSPTILKVSKALLSRQSHIVTTAVNGAEAVDLIARNCKEDSEPQYDVVLMDLQMPIMDGLEATRRIKIAESDLLVREHNVNPPPGCASSDSCATAPDTYNYVSASCACESVDFGDLTLADNSTNNNQRNLLTTPPTRPSVITERQRVSIGSNVWSDLTDASPWPSGRSTAVRFRTFIIGVSANCDADTVSAAYAAGADAFIPKPFTVKQFNETYCDLVRKHGGGGW